MGLGWYRFDISLQSEDLSGPRKILGIGTDRSKCRPDQTSHMGQCDLGLLWLSLYMLVLDALLYMYCKTSLCSIFRATALNITGVQILGKFTVQNEHHKECRV